MEHRSTPILLQPRHQDVLLGRGGQANNQWGNIRFRSMIRECVDVYRTVEEKTKKDMIVNEIIRAVCRDGRFLRKIPSSKPEAWEIADDKTILRKVKQAFRDQSAAANQDSKKDPTVHPGYKKVFSHLSSGLDSTKTPSGPTTASSANAKSPTAGKISHLDLGRPCLAADENPKQASTAQFNKENPQQKRQFMPTQVLSALRRVELSQLLLQERLKNQRLKQLLGRRSIPVPAPTAVMTRQEEEELELENRNMRRQLEGFDDQTCSSRESILLAKVERLQRVKSLQDAKIKQQMLQRRHRAFIQRSGGGRETGTEVNQYIQRLKELSAECISGP